MMGLMLRKCPRQQQQLLQQPQHEDAIQKFGFRDRIRSFGRRWMIHPIDEGAVVVAVAVVVVAADEDAVAAVAAVAVVSC